MIKRLFNSLLSVCILACGDKSQDSAEDVDATTSEVVTADQDGDGITVAEGDCNDADASIFPYDRSEYFGNIGCGWEVSSGIGYVCGLSSAGEISCWGEDNGAGNLEAPAGRFVELSVGTGHACAIDEENMLTCWGWGTYGQTGLNPTADSMLTNPVKSVSAGAYQTCAIGMDDHISCMGSYNAGMWSWSNSTFKSLHTAMYHSCAVRSDSQIECVISIEENGVSLIEAIDPAPEDNYRSVASLYSGMSCALNEVGAVRCWGEYTTDYILPTESVVSLAGGASDHFCAILSDQTLACWGGGVWMNLAFGQTNPPEGTFQSIDLGDTHGCGVKTTGEIHCWGSLIGNPVEW